jgi:PAP2 superfamily
MSATTADARVPTGFARWRTVAAGPIVAVGILVWAIVATGSVGLVVRDPDHVAAQYFVLVGTGAALLVVLDVMLRAARRTGSFPPPRAAMAAVRRERWTPWRAAAAGSALFAFYVSYMAYRNLKAIVPLARPDQLFDTQLAEFDRAIFAGNDPATLLHSLIGTGVTTHVLSTAYVAFIVFLPLTIGVSLVFSRELEAGLFYTTAQSINWVLGAASYFLLPSLGPVYADPRLFSALPSSEVTHLQGVLMDQRVAFLAHPASATPQAIAAFASLHISMSFSAAVAAHLLGLGQRLKIALWTWFGVTMVGTIYLGWHYVADNVAGVIMGAMALALAGLLTGVDLRTARTRRAGLVAVRDEAAAES